MSPHLRNVPAKRSLSDLAVFGGKPLFGRPRPIGQLAAIDIDQFLATFRESYEARHLTNNGPLVRRLESTLAELHGVPHCICLANAALGITMLLQIFAKGRSGEVIMPAFSYRGLPYLAQWAGQTPIFCDVDPESHTLDPDAVRICLNENTTSILAVPNFNAPGDINSLCQVAHYYKVPIFIDSVNAIGSTYQGRMLGSFAAAEVYSLHATKLLNGFEGGYITTNDAELASLLRRQRNFALPGTLSIPEDYAHAIGLNAKLNEMHAAMALLSVQELDSIISRNRMRFHAYCTGLSGIEGLRLLPYTADEQCNYQMAVAEVTDTWPLGRDRTVALLRAEGAAITAYYSPPLHRSEHCPPGLGVPELPVSEDLATRFIQLPVGDLVTLDDIERICQLLSFIQEHGATIIKRMVSAGGP